MKQNILMVEVQKTNYFKNGWTQFWGSIATRTNAAQCLQLKDRCRTVAFRRNETITNSQLFEMFNCLYTNNIN